MMSFCQMVKQDLNEEEHHRDSRETQGEAEHGHGCFR